ncbi:hypothetical protein ACGFJ7_30535 [Actinoplanes sp. NPDC048988]|uniref:hypothetical protein n=1 Tax=Actinoplanes sp. NPDC048988 TaxID=3363901 RepID=UPI00372220DF
MTEHVLPTDARVAWRDVPVAQRVLSVLTAALLGVDAFVHLHDAGRYDQFRTSVLSEGTLFEVQAIVAVLVAIALLLRLGVLTWAVSLLVAGSAAVAVTLYTYVNVGALGPVPNLYENTWHGPGKVGSAVAETIAALLAVAGLVLAVRARRRHS